MSRKPNILLIDSDLMILESLGQALSIDYTVIPARDRREAVCAFMMQTPDQPIDLVLIDVNLWNGEALETVLLLTTLKRNLPAIGMTTNPEHTRCAAFAFDHLLEKPVNPALLIKTINGLISRASERKSDECDGTLPTKHHDEILNKFPQRNPPNQKPFHVEKTGKRVTKPRCDKDWSEVTSSKHLNPANLVAIQRPSAYERRLLKELTTITERVRGLEQGISTLQGRLEKQEVPANKQGDRSWTDRACGIFTSIEKIGFRFALMALLLTGVIKVLKADATPNIRGGWHIQDSMEVSPRRGFRYPEEYLEFREIPWRPINLSRKANSIPVSTGVESITPKLRGTTAKHI